VCKPGPGISAEAIQAFKEVVKAERGHLDFKQLNKAVHPETVNDADCGEILKKDWHSEENDKCWCIGQTNENGELFGKGVLVHSQGFLWIAHFDGTGTPRNAYHYLDSNKYVMKNNN